MINVYKKYISQYPIHSWDFRFKVIKTIAFFTIIFAPLHIILQHGLRRESQSFQVIFIILFLTIFLAILITIFRSKRIKNAMGRILLYMIAFAIQFVLFHEIYDFISHWYDFKNLLPHRLESLGNPSKWEYTFRNVALIFKNFNSFFNYLLMIFSVSNAFIVNIATFTELTWRNNSQKLTSQNPFLNTIYFLIILAILGLSGSILSLEFFESILLSVTFIISNIMILGSLTYALFKIVQTKYIPFILYFSLGFFGSLGLAYLWFPFTENYLLPYGEKFSLLALVGQSWLYPLIFSLFFKSRIQEDSNHD